MTVLAGSPHSSSGRENASEVVRQRCDLDVQCENIQTLFFKIIEEMDVVRLVILFWQHERASRELAGKVSEFKYSDIVS